MTNEIFTIPDDVPQIGAIYTHYKNPHHEYKVTGVSLNSDSDEWHVEYVPLYEDAVAPKFNRSISKWFDRAVIDGKEVERYTLVRVE